MTTFFLARFLLSLALTRFAVAFLTALVFVRRFGAAFAFDFLAFFRVATFFLDLGMKSLREFPRDAIVSGT
jgi:hypothetical protein